jgi:hypothetical protein
MPKLPSKGFFLVVLIALLISSVIILAVLVFLDYPFLRTTDNLNILLTFAITFFALVEVLSTLSKASIEKKEKRTIDLRDELEKLYGPVYFVLNNAVHEEIETGILTLSQKKLMDETFSKEPFILDSQTEWKTKIRNRPVKQPPDVDIPMKFIEYFNNEYERNKGKDVIEKQFSDIYSMFKNVPQKVEEVCILHPDEKILVDKKFSAYPYMPTQELYDYWNKEIRFLELTMTIMPHVFRLLENPRPNLSDSNQNTSGLYLVPKPFITKFLKEYDNKVREYRKP